MKLFDFQKEAVSFCLERDRSLLALDTGLGKSRVCIEVAKKEKDNITVICPAFLKLNWKNEIAKWGYKGHLSCLSYEGAMCLETIGQGLLVIDEAHYLRNWTAQRTRHILLKLVPQASRLILSTATPIVRSASDLHPILSVLQPGKWGKYSAYCAEYCEKKFNAFSPRGFDWVGVRNEEALRRKMKKFTFIRHKKDVMEELPEKTVIDTWLDLPEARPVENTRIQVGEDVALGALTELVKSERKRIGMSKVWSVCEFAENFNAETPLVIFGWHKQVLESIGRELGCPVITGDSSMVSRNDLIQKFQSGEINKLVASIGACGVGVNLQRASNAIFAELPWTAAEFKQCSDRLWRIGQPNAVTIYRMLARGTIDEPILRSLSAKREVSEKLGVSVE